jgi:cytochrome c oxidase subunit 1
VGARGIETPFLHGPRIPGTPEWARYFSVDYSHKVIGVQYAITGILLLGVGGTLAMIFRLQLAQPELNFIAPDVFNTMISAHGMIMIGGILLGIGGMFNYLTPLMIGANDMAFPRLNAFAYWINVPGAILLCTAMFIGGWNTGWTGYPPLSAHAPLGVQYFFLGVFFIGLSSILGALNIDREYRSRCVRLACRLFRMPIFVWAALARRPSSSSQPRSSSVCPS